MQRLLLIVGMMSMGALEYILLIVGVIVVFLFLCIKRWSNSAEGRGALGEEKVSKILGETIEGEKYVYNDYRFRDGDITIQIDHLLVNHCGIFVIETKNYSGVIYGNETSHQWTQVLAGGNVKNKLYNPVKQNASHIYHLKEFLPYGVPIISVVVFVQNNTEKIECDNVVPLAYLAKYLNSFREEKINDAQLRRIIDLLDGHLDLEITKDEHIQNIQDMSDKIEQGICPRCGGKLVLRDGKYGEFYGCSNYPKCKFKKNAD